MDPLPKNKISGYNPDFNAVFAKFLNAAQSLCQQGRTPDPAQQEFYIDDTHFVLVSVCEAPNESGDYSMDVELKMKIPTTIESMDSILIITITGSAKDDSLLYDILMPVAQFEFDNLNHLLKVINTIKTFASHIIFNLQE